MSTTSLSKNDKKKQKKEKKRSDELTLTLSQDEESVELSKKEANKMLKNSKNWHNLCGGFRKELVIVQRIIDKREEEKRKKARQIIIRIVRSIHEKHQRQKGKERKATQE
jgi:hypothetical protein